MPAMPGRIPIRMPAVPEMPSLTSVAASGLRISGFRNQSSTFDGLKDKATSALDDFDPSDWRSRSRCRDQSAQAPTPTPQAPVAIPSTQNLMFP